MAFFLLVSLYPNLVESIVLRSLSVLLLGSIPFVANATLIGDTVHIAQNYPVIGSEHFPVDIVVGSGTEFSWRYFVDVDAGSVEITFSNVSFVDVPAGGNNFNGPMITGLNDSSGNPLVGFSNFQTDTGFNPVNILYGSDFIGFNFDSLSFSEGSYIHVDLTFENTQNDVPEPTTLALLGLGLLGLAVRSRKASV